jgi:hypothetical protein
MQIRITTWTGSQGNGIVLATHGSTMRVAIPGCDDVAEFSCRGGQWFSDAGQPVEIGFPASEDANNGFASATNNWTENKCLGPNSWPVQPLSGSIN